MRVRRRFRGRVAVVVCLGFLVRSAGADDGGPPSPPPANVAKGALRSFAKLGLDWTLPGSEPGSAKWSFVGGNADLGPTDTGWAAQIELATDDRLKPIEGELAVRPYEAAQPLAAFLMKGKKTDPIVGILDGDPAPVVSESIPVGNAHGGSLTATGKARAGARKAPGQALEIRVYFALVRGVAYQLNLFLRGDAGKRYAADVKALIEGLRWEDTKEGVWGPYLWAVMGYSEPRGDLPDKAIDVKVTKAHGFTITKPKGWRMWRIEGAQPEFQYFQHQVWWFGAEARTDTAFAMFAVLTYPIADLVKETPPKDAGGLIDDAEKRWKEQFLDAVTRPRSKESNHDDGAFKEGKGLTYDFRGSLAGVSYSEKGWLVRMPQYLYWIRTQYGGKDAEATFADAVKALSKGFTYEK